MKLALSSLLLVLSAMFAVPANTKSPAQMGGARLQLSTSVQEYWSCAPYHVTLRLHLTFKNTGTESIILDKRSSVVGRHYVSRDLRAAAAKQYEDLGRAEYDFGPQIPDALEVPTDMSNFIILAPGQGHEVESDWSTVHLTVNDGSPHFEAGLSFGLHFLQVLVGTWPHASEDVVKRARKQWRQKGFLWTEPLMSDPMQFTIDPKRPISKCS